MTALMQGGATTALPSVRSIRHALGVLERLPAAALADLAEHLVDRLDAIDGDPDLEPEEDDDDDEAEDDLSPPGTLRPERDGLVRVWRRPAPEDVPRRERHP